MTGNRLDGSTARITPGICGTVELADSWRTSTPKGPLMTFAAPEARCIVCGCPSADHVALRYPLRAWLLHMLPASICRWLKPLRR